MLIANKCNSAPTPRKRIRGCSVQEILSDEKVEIRVDTDIKIGKTL